MSNIEITRAAKCKDCKYYGVFWFRNFPHYRGWCNLRNGPARGKDDVCKIREAVNFLCTVFNDDIPTVADIRTAQAEGDSETLLKYLFYIRAYVIKLIDKLK